MWLVPRHSRGLSLRTDVPVVVRDALVRWYEGEGTDADHRASVTMVVKARTHGQWIACDCLGGETPPPLMSPSYLSEAETYYLRRLTSTRQKRPEHLTDCPFYREQAPQRFREKRSAIPSTIDEPHGLFNAHRLAPEKLAAMPDDSEPDDRTRGVAIPRLARLLWLLMEMAHVNVVEPLPPDQGRDTSMAKEFARLRRAAERLDIAPGIPLAKHFYTHVDPYDRNVVFARLRKAAAKWPSGLAPQAFLALYALDISGTTITLAEGRELEVKTRIQYAGARVGPPYLVLVVVGEHNPRDGFAALRGYAQPIARPSSFIAVHNQAERDAVIGLLDLQYRWRRRQIDIGFKRPLFDLTTRAGPLRPDLVLDIRDNSTGELIEAALEVIANDEPDYIDAKQRKISALAELGPTVFARAATLRDHGIEAILKANLGIG